MQIETSEHLSLDCSRYTITEEETIRKYNAASPTRAFEHGHNILKKEQSCLGSSEAVGKVIEDALLFRATKWWISRNYIHALYISDLTNIYCQGIAFAQIWCLNTVEPHIHHA